ncbi:MAG: tetratricopeptide repeat protein, partial [Thermodesulfobacteriota bacterium]
MNLGRLFLLCLVLCGLPGRASGFAGGAAGLVDQGNAAFAAGDFAGALEFYERAAAKDPRPEIAFNRAGALYRLGKTEEAAALWQEAAAAASNPALAYAARYNAGNAFYRQGEEAITGDPDAALDLFGTSADSFRAALAADPGGPDAGRNLELANRRIAQLRQRLQQEKQQQGQSGGNGQEKKDQPDAGQGD